MPSPALVPSARTARRTWTSFAIRRGIGEPRGERRLLALERLDPRGQRLELARLPVAELRALGLGGGRRRRRRLARLRLLFLRRRARALPVAVAAGVLLPAAVAFVGDGLGDDVVEEGAVVADEEEGAGVVLQERLE